MTDQEKLAAQEAERARKNREEALRVRKQFDACGIAGEPCGFSMEETYLPMADGIRLYMRIYRPEGKSVYPVLIQRSCYPHQMEIYEVYGEELAKRGYGYILQVCRGTGQSEGEWYPNVNERADGLTTLEWLNAQDWCESIGYFGASYLALTGWAIADAVPDKVKGMMLTVYGTDRFKSAYEKRLFRHDILTGWSMSNAGHPVAADYLESCRYRPHAKVDEALWGGKLDWYQDYIHSVNRSDPYWQHGWWKQLAEIPSKTKVPIFLIDAWYDHHFGSAMNTYLSLDEETKKHSWMDIGCWNHSSQECIEWGEQHNIENGDVKRLLEWFGLLLIEKKIPEKRIRAYVMREDRWQELEDWPVPKKEEAVYCLTADKGLTESKEEAAARAGEVSFDYDPEDPCPSHGAESCLTMMEEAGSLLQPAPDYRPDVVSFISEPLTEEKRIAGGIKVHLTVKTDVDDTAFSAKLCEVFPDGKAYNIHSGITTIAADLPEGAEYHPGDAVQVTVDFWDIVWTLQPGSRIRLDISSSDFPQYAAHSNYAGIWADQEKTRVAHQTICAGEGSRLVLPLL
ncbi:MAG: CocE/NonD family hydrolase [Lachnospiraceae bacterium]|nr:CocE/NonD family hydrolase [Lachnospiraceae bacterium]